MTKINQVLTEWIPGDLHSLRWFKERGIAQNMAYEYYQSGSLDKLGPGIYCRKNEPPKWQGGVKLLQVELKKDIHVSSRAALELQGHSHYLPLGDKPTIYLATYSKATIPPWFNKIDFDCEFRFTSSTLISGKLELTDYEDTHGFNFKISSREMAILELLNTLDLSKSFETAENYLNSMQTLRPKVVQGLLENCTSVKIKRVFLYLSEKLELPYFKQLKLQRIDLGSGKRQIVKDNSQLDKKYKITVPKDYGENHF